MTKGCSLAVNAPLYESIEDGTRLFDVRLEGEADFCVGDWVTLREYAPHDFSNGTPGGFTGRRCKRQISFILPTSMRTGPFNYLRSTGLEDGFVILGFAPPISKLECQLQGHELFLGTTDQSAVRTATKFLVDMNQFVNWHAEKRAREKAKQKVEEPE